MVPGEAILQVQTIQTTKVGEELNNSVHFVNVDLATGTCARAFGTDAGTPITSGRWGTLVLFDV